MHFARKSNAVDLNLCVDIQIRAMYDGDLQTNGHL